MEELIPIFFFVSAAAVLILRPLTKKLGALAEAVARSKAGTPADAAELARLRAALEHTTRRLDLVEERLDFTERLVSAAQRRSGRSGQLGGPAFDPVGVGGFDAVVGAPDYVSR